MNTCTPPEIPALRGPVPLSHMFIRRFVGSGDRVIDATCGNGHDTLLLAELVGPTGRVWAFDIQEKAISATTNRLRLAGYTEFTELVCAGHETIARHCSGPISAAIFNLGYLPGGDRSRITRAETTLAGLEQTLDILAPAGIAAISVYPGHDGGQLEQTAVEAWSSRLAPSLYHVWRMGQMNVAGAAPYFILIQKVC